MFRNIDKSNDLLFFSLHLSDRLRQAVQSLRQEVESTNENRFLNTAPDDLKSYLVERYSVTPITLLKDHCYANHEDVSVDVRHDRRRSISDRNRPAMVPGERVEVRIPFEGDADLLYSKADNFSLNPPRAKIEGSEVVLRYETPSDETHDIRASVDDALRNIQEHLGWQRQMIEAPNKGLSETAEQVVQQRRERLLAQSKRAEAPGIPIQQRDDAPKTYAVLTVTRKAVPMLPAVQPGEFKPEPALAMELYEHISKVVQDMTLVIERSPEAFKTMDEEALRQHFLVQLNGHVRQAKRSIWEARPTYCCGRAQAMSLLRNASFGRDIKRSARLSLNC